MTEPLPDTTAMQSPPGGPPPPRLLDAARAQPWLAAGLVIVLVAVGYLIGTSRGGVSWHTGLVYAAEGQISVTADGWTYSIPLDVPWDDADGGLHLGERPSCLLPSAEQVSVRFAAVEFSLNGQTDRRVVQVSCPNVAPLSTSP
jgi:hypothetical protein